MLAYLVGVKGGGLIVLYCVRSCMCFAAACLCREESHICAGGRNEWSSCPFAPRSIPPRSVCSARSRAVLFVSHSMEAS